jgi:hypothetical protein
MNTPKEYTSKNANRKRSGNRAFAWKFMDFEETTTNSRKGRKGRKGQAHGLVD